ncbi:hypothetical protein HJFPF1_07294 [Paramyrothecium foliicola]|nr:hypothetical protein HJFPF1_07294 [Paramyrothecium foliicola]
MQTSQALTPREPRPQAEAYLPPEVWLEIVSLTNLATAKAASRASKRFRQLFLRRIFQSCYIRFPHQLHTLFMHQEPDKSLQPLRHIRNVARHLTFDSLRALKYGSSGKTSIAMLAKIVACIQRIPLLSRLSLNLAVPEDEDKTSFDHIIRKSSPWSVQRLFLEDTGNVTLSILEKCHQLQEFGLREVWPLEEVLEDKILQQLRISHPRLRVLHLAPGFGFIPFAEYEDQYKGDVEVRSFVEDDYEWTTGNSPFSPIPFTRGSFLHCCLKNLEYLQTLTFGKHMWLHSDNLWEFSFREFMNRTDTLIRWLNSHKMLESINIQLESHVVDYLITSTIPDSDSMSFKESFIFDWYIKLLCHIAQAVLNLTVVRIIDYPRRVYIAKRETKEQAFTFDVLACTWYDSVAVWDDLCG